MAPKGKKRQSSTYDSDNGFVANDSGNNEVSHRAKKARTTKPTTSSTKPKSSSFKPATAAKPAGEGKVDSNGDQYWELSRLRRVTVSSFKGRNMVNVREYYEKDGQELPGKKGISMPVDQFSSMVKILPNIEAALKEKGESLPRPEYGVSGEQGGEEEEEEDEDEDENEGDDDQDEGQWENASEEEEEKEEEEEEVKPRSKKDKQAKKKKNGVRKKNIEATSDEDE